MNIKDYGWTVGGYMKKGFGYPAGEHLPLTDRNIQEMHRRGKSSVYFHGLKAFDYDFFPYVGLKLRFVFEREANIYEENWNKPMILASYDEVTIKSFNSFLKKIKSSLRIPLSKPSINI